MKANWDEAKFGTKHFISSSKLFDPITKTDSFIFRHVWSFLDLSERYF